MNETKHTGIVTGMKTHIRHREKLTKQNTEQKI